MRRAAVGSPADGTDARGLPCLASGAELVLPRGRWGERRMLLMVAAARTAPRLGWRTRRHSATSAASLLGQQRPSEPRYPAASQFTATHSGTISHATQYPTAALYKERYILCPVVPHSGSVSRSDMVSLGMGSIVVATSQGRTSDVERGSTVTGNGRGRERAMRAHAGCLCSSSGCNYHQCG